MSKKQIEHKVDVSQYIACSSKADVDSLVRQLGLKRLHVQLIPTARNGANKLLGRTLRVGSYDEDGFWLASDPNTCLSYGSCVVAQAVRPNVSRSDVYICMANNISVLLEELPEMERGEWRKLINVEYNDGRPFVSVEEEKDGVDTVKYFPAHAFLFSFYPREFDLAHFTRKGFKEQDKPFLKMSFAGAYDENRAVVKSSFFSGGEHHDGFGIWDTNKRAMITKVGHFSSVAEALAFQITGE